MSNWYAYKVLADTYNDDRFAAAARHRQARQATRSKRAAVSEAKRARHALATSAASPSGSVTRSGWWPSLLARLRRRRPVAPLAATPRPAADLHPSMPC